MSTDDEREYLDALTEILTVFDDDTEMTADILACPPGQHTAESAALVKIREIGRRVMEGREGDAVTAVKVALGYAAQPHAASAEIRDAAWAALETLSGKEAGDAP